MSAPHVIVGLSGGVDSAVAAWRLQEQGYRVSGLFMQNWTEDEQAYCTAAEDFRSARAVADELRIPLHRADFAAEYRERVFEHFLDAYRAGRTP
ncbi:MAG: tRNA 2-thiouridine(34) synthase MnmA, partial [Panacagrimonas sp.]